MVIAASPHRHKCSETSSKKTFIFNHTIQSDVDRLWGDYLQVAIAPVEDSHSREYAVPPALHIFELWPGWFDVNNYILRILTVYLCLSLLGCLIIVLYSTVHVFIGVCMCVVVRQMTAAVCR